jgi:predicted transcriptional regulator
MKTIYEDLIKQNLSTYKIAEKLGVSQGTVCRKLKLYNLKTIPYPVKKCKNCNSNIKSRNTFCDNKCQGIYYKAIKIKAIEKEQEIPNGTTDAFAKKYLIDKYGHICSICNLTSWNSKEIPLVFDHIDGNYTNRKLSNLRLVCGNCDMQLPTYKSKNRGNGRHSRKQRYADNKSY